MKRWRKWICIAAGGVPLATAVYLTGRPGVGIPVALAQTAPTAAVDPQPGAAAADPSGQPYDAMIEFLRWRSLGVAPLKLQPAEADEWNKLKDFLHVNCPNRAMLLDRQEPGPGSLVRIKMLLRWENMEQAKREQPPLFDVLAAEWKQEDVLVGLSIQYRQARNHANPELFGQVHRQMEQEALKLVDLNLQERQFRIQHAQELLAAQMTSLSNDKGDEVALARQRVREFLQQVGMPQFGRRGGPPPDSQSPAQNPAPNGQTSTPTAATVQPAKPSN